MEPALGAHELLHVFSFLEARDLLCAAQVDKVTPSVQGGSRAVASPRAPGFLSAREESGG